MYIDFRQIKRKIKYQIQIIEQNININSNDELFSLYLYLHKVRHDLLHYLILEMLGKSWQDETTLNNYFSDLPFEMGKKTPDIVLLRDNVWYVVDVSVSLDVAKNENKKYLKYNPIVEHIRKVNNLKCEYIHINLNHEYTNYQLEMNKIDFLKKKLILTLKHCFGHQ